MFFIHESIAFVVLYVRYGCSNAFLLAVVFFQRGEAKLLTEDWEGAVEDLKSAAQKSPQVSSTTISFFIKFVLENIEAFVICVYEIN